MPAATTHTATYEPTFARVRLNLSGFETGTTAVQVTRTDQVTGRVALVRGCRAIPITTPASDTIQVYDYEFPAGRTVEYAYFQVPDTTRYQLATPAGYDVAGMWLKHVTRPNLSRIIRPGADLDGYHHDLRAAVSAPVRTVVPLGGGDVRGGRTFRLPVMTDSRAEREDLDNLLKVGGVCYLQVPSTDLTLLESAYVQITAASERLRGPAVHGRRWFDLDFAEVQPPDADLAAAAVTWNDVVAAYATWDDLVAAVPTWNDLLAQVADPVEVIV